METLKYNRLHCSCLTEDENAQRREVVRRKTARYLIKAEELYHKYLADVEEQERNRWDVSSSKSLYLAWFVGYINLFVPCLDVFYFYV